MNPPAWSVSLLPVPARLLVFRRARTLPAYLHKLPVSQGDQQLGMQRRVRIAQDFFGGG
jgi:hypothetical protein